MSERPKSASTCLETRTALPTPAELDEMRKLVAQAMEDGAVGLSTSLVYAPAFYAKTEELIELAKVAARYGGVYATHMRNESNSIMTALDEAIRIGTEANIPVEIFHLKMAGKPNWGKMRDVIAKIESCPVHADWTSPPINIHTLRARPRLAQMFRPGPTKEAPPSSSRA